jgi:hypothetical protein
MKVGIILTLLVIAGCAANPPLSSSDCAATNLGRPGIASTVCRVTPPAHNAATRLHWLTSRPSTANY